MPSLVVELARALEADGIDLTGLGLAWARVLPTVTLVPAFGLRALPAPARAVIGLALAASIFPALDHGRAAFTHDAPWPLLVFSEMLRGLPVAIAAAVPLWAATMAGGVADALRGGATDGGMAAPTVEGRASPLGVPMSLLASAIFLSLGGPARVASALTSAAAPASHPLMAAAADIASGITLAVAMGAPVLAASLVFEVAGALIARAAAPAQVQMLLAPLRALALLAFFGIVVERVAAVLAIAIARSTPF